MQRVIRLSLDKRTQSYLTRRQKQADSKHRNNALDVTGEWNSARQTQSMRKVVKTLQKMMGAHERCMYCLDSHGSDIEHFRPKATFPKRMFRWRNLLLCCSECGRLKGNQFPVDQSRPLLIDPTKEEPWHHLDFDPITGNMTARFDANLNDWSAKGSKTVEVLHLDSREALSNGYKRTYQRLSAIVLNFLETHEPSDSQFINSLQAMDDHGLLGWIFIGTGQNEAPFRLLREQHSELWNQCLLILGFHQNA